MPKNVSLGSGGRGGKKMYPGGSKRFNESTGTYRGGAMPRKPGMPKAMPTYNPRGARPGAGTKPRVNPAGRAVPGRAVGLGGAMNRKAALRGRAGTRGVRAPARRMGFKGAR
jgi:hypothetical protein